MFKYNEQQEIVGSSKTHTDECPNCEAENLEYDPQEFVSENLISQVCRCKYCGFTFTNFYTIKYTGFAAHDIDFDEEGEVI